VLEILLIRKWARSKVATDLAEQEAPGCARGVVRTYVTTDMPDAKL